MEPGERGVLHAELSRRGFLGRAGALGLGALVLSAAPAAPSCSLPQRAGADPAGGRRCPTRRCRPSPTRSSRGARPTAPTSATPIHPRAIAGVDPRPGAVEADALALYHHPLTGFDALEPAFLADLQARSLPRGGDFLDAALRRARGGLPRRASTSTTRSRLVWEAAAAVPFTAFCAAALIPEQTAAKASGYRVMGLPGRRAARATARFSYRRRLVPRAHEEGIPA